MSLGRVVVVGLGLIGGSIVKALRERTELAAAGIDHPEVLALADAWIDTGAVPGSKDAADLLGSADLVVFAAPTRIILADLVPTLDALAPSAALTDTASVKRALVERASAHPRASRYVAGHPMAGREIGGFEASRASLFDGASWFLVESGADRDAFERVHRLVLALGASPRVVDAESHDRAMAVVSHLPHLVASALAELAAMEKALPYAGPGFQDTTRIAGGPEAIWGDIFAENREPIVAALDALILRLDGIKTALASGEREGVAAALELLAGARRARSFRNESG